MARKFNIWSFYSCLLCLFLTVHLAYTYFNQKWIVAPPSYILFLLAVLTFVFGMIGISDKTNGWSIMRSWITGIVAAFLCFVLFFSTFSYVLISEDHMLSTESPDKEYKIQFYLTNGGATTAFGVLGKLDGPLWFTKTIYNDYRMDQAEIKWIDNHTVSINNHILDLKEGDTFSD